jgi:hypothetical protein
MKYLSKRLLIAVVLMAAALSASSTDAQRTDDPAGQDGRVFFSLSQEARPDGFEATLKNGAVAGMTVVNTDGSRADLKRQSKPSGATSCKKGETLSCWEDEAQMMSVCVCGTALSGIPLAKPIVGSSTPAAGSTGGIPLSRPIVGMTATARRRYDIVGAFPKKLE